MRAPEERERAGKGFGEWVSFRGTKWSIDDGTGWMRGSVTVCVMKGEEIAGQRRAAKCSRPTAKPRRQTATPALREATPRLS